MDKITPILTACFLFLIQLAAARAGAFEKDVFPTSQGELAITFIGHGTLMLEWAGRVIHVDPVSDLADYKTLPKADLILITHEHGDHLSPQAIDLLRREKTEIILTERAAEKLAGGTVMKNGDSLRINGIGVEAVPAYNIVHLRSQGYPYHPRGQGNGYILTLEGKRIYIAGDSENTPEMKALKNIDIAFLPMNLPYTMTPEMVADAARAFKPKVLYPYHYGSTDPAKLTELLIGQTDVEVRIRQLR